MPNIIAPFVTPGMTSSGDAAGITVGTVVPTTEAGSMMYVIAGSAIAIYDAVAILNSSSATGATIAAYPITTTNAAGSPRVGFAQTAIAAASYGWVTLSGNNLRVNVAIACQPGVPLYTTATGGVLDDAVVSGGYVQGIVAKTSAASASAVQCIAGFANVAIIG